MKDLTLILLIKDRPKFFERWVDYIVFKKPNFFILISDGGKKKVDEKNFIKLRKNNIKFKYVKFNYDKDYFHYNKKIFKSLKMCKSKYVVLCFDDDLYINASFYRGINFLKKNPKYVCYGAKNILFGASNKYDQINSLPTNFSEMHCNKKVNNKSSSIKERLFFFLKNSNNATSHNIFKREVMITAYDKVLKSNLRLPDLVDLYVNSLVYCMGHVRTSKEIMRMKQYHPSSDGKVRDINVTTLDPKFSKENNELVNKITNFIISKKNNKQELMNEVKKRFDQHYYLGKKAYLEKANKFKNISKIVSIKNFILNKNVNKFYYYFKKDRCISEFKKFINNINDKRVKNEINSILQFFRER